MPSIVSFCHGMSELRALPPACSDDDGGDGDAGGSGGSNAVAGGGSGAAGAGGAAGTGGAAGGSAGSAARASDTRCRHDSAQPVHGLAQSKQSRKVADRDFALSPPLCAAVQASLTPPPSTTAPSLPTPRPSSIARGSSVSARYGALAVPRGCLAAVPVIRFAASVPVHRE